jgi:hypothetical protein
MEIAGPHQQVERLDRADINGLRMVMCRICNTFAHAHTDDDAVRDLGNTNCSPDCENCKRLRHSYDGAPAVPTGGSCNDELHVCPNDGNRWWQTNSHFHLWKQVTHDREWEVLNRPRERCSEESGFGLGW